MAKAETQTVVIISYNTVRGFCNGWHGGTKLFIHANKDGQRGWASGQGNDDYERAQSVMAGLRHDFYGALQIPVNNVKQYYIYAGLYAMKTALEMAEQIKAKTDGAPVTVVACGCKWGEKKQILNGTSIPMVECSCGGEKYLGQLAQDILDA